MATKKEALDFLREKLGYPLGGKQMLPRIAIDMDETIVDLTGPWFRILNEAAFTNYTRDDIDMYDCVEKWKGTLTKEMVLSPFYREGFWRNLPPLDGAIEAVKFLYSYGYEIYIVSNPWRSATCASEKIQWVNEHLPFIGEDNFVLTPNKHLIRANFFIDDHIKMIQHCHGIRILIDRGWNRDLGDIPKGWFKRVKDMTEAANFIMKYR
jgi:5'(3')-deoxyribonucleotidase